MLESTTGFRGRLIAYAAVTAAVAGALAFNNGQVGAQDSSGRQCSAHTLRGDYGFLVWGFKPIPPQQGVLERFNAVGVWDFDGNGTFTVEPGGALIGELTGVNPEPTNPVGTLRAEPQLHGHHGVTAESGVSSVYPVHDCSRGQRP